MQKISIVIPVYNEEENIEELYKRLKAVLCKDFGFLNYEILFVDDGSIDNTLNLICDLIEKDSFIKVVQLSRNFGHHIAISAGLDHADGDLIVTMDGDLQDQPEEMIKLYNKLTEGNDVVYGDRQNKKFSWFKRVCSKVFITLINFLVDQDIVINSHIFRIMKRQVVKEVIRCKEFNRYVVGLIGWVGFRHASVSVEHGKRFSGKTKYTFSKLVKLALDAIFTFSDYPLKLIIRVGFALVVISFAFGGYIFLNSALYGSTVAGWPSLITAVFFIGGIQTFMLGIIGEYLGRTYMETKRRPLYIVRKIVDSNSLKVGCDYEKNSFVDRSSGIYR